MLGRLVQLDINLLRLTLLCFLAYAVISGLISQIGTVSGSLAQHYSVSISASAASFGYLSTGTLIGTFLSVFAFEWLSLKRAFLLCYSIAALGILSIAYVDQWTWLPIAWLVAGGSAGLGLCAAAVCLSALYTGRARATALLSTDMFFAGTGALISPLAASMIDKGGHWYDSYLILAIACVVMVAVSAYSCFPLTAKETKTADGLLPKGVPVWLCGAGLFAYLLGQVVMLIWLPNYMQTALGADLGQSAATIGRYWTGMVIGQVMLVLLLPKVPVHKLLGTIVGLSIIASVPLWTSTSATQIGLFAILLGVCNAGILKLTIAHAATLVRHPQRAVTMMLVCGGAGQAVAPFLSSVLVEVMAAKSALLLTTFCYLLAAVAIGRAVSMHRTVSGVNG